MKKREKLDLGDLGAQTVITYFYNSSKRVGIFLDA